jgi:amino acid adenylation domain-containing protein
MLEDSAPVALLTASSLQQQLPVTTIPTFFLDDLDAWALQPTHNPALTDLTSQHLAYVIYTSGSTGQPKGVMVEHAQVVRLLAATDDDFHFGPEDVWTLFHSYAFDFSVWELWGALAYGGRLVIVPSLCARSPKDFYALLCREQVTVLNQTPSAFRSLISAQDEQAHRLRYVIFGGEALELHALAPWIERNDPQQTRLINMYGITEITVHATYRAITREDVESGRGSVVGRGLPDLRVYILDRYGEPVPVGVTGEIYVGGAGVARGYLHRPKLTAERFLCDPFQVDPTARMYKSGDLGKWLPDGTIEYLGRNDFQVKIRGFRIELGEIEAKLAQQPGVRDAVVIAREDIPGNKRLVAYLTTQEGGSVVAAELRNALAKELAEYMVPSAFVQLTHLPLTPNGKLDRQALLAPDQHAVAARAYEAPQGEVEETMAVIWQELLGLQRVGRHDDFFELGGHSLLAVQLVARLRHACRVDVPLAALFHKPQLALLAGFVLSLQVETFLGDDLETIQQELDSMSEEELLAILEKDAIRE